MEQHRNLVQCHIITSVEHHHGQLLFLGTSCRQSIVRICYKCWNTYKDSCQMVLTTELAKILKFCKPPKHYVHCQLCTFIYEEKSIFGGGATLSVIVRIKSLVRRKHLVLAATFSSRGCTSFVPLVGS